MLMLKLKNVIQLHYLEKYVRENKNHKTKIWHCW